MRIEDLSIEQLVEYINKQLQLGRTMREIEKNDFGVNDRVIVKRLNRKGYKRVNNEFLEGITKDIQRDNKKIKSIEKSNDIQRYNKSIDEEKLVELIELLEPIRNLIKDYERNKNVIEVETVELKPKAVLKIKQKLFKIDVEILEQWEEFIINHKEFKVQQLISMALEEFIQKYS